MRRTSADEAPGIQALAETVQLSDLPDQVAGQPILGLSSDTLGPAAFEASGSFLLCGPPLSGRTTALHTLSLALLRQDPNIQLHYFGNLRSRLATLPFWTSTSSPSDAAEGAATIHTSVLDGPPQAVFIENVADFVNTPADMPLQTLIKLVNAEGGFVVVEGESSGLTGTMGLLGLAKLSRAGLALSPDQGDGNLFRTNFPRMNPNERLPGRGLLIRAGRTEVVQVALPLQP